MASANITAAFPGHNNQGFQGGYNYGHINNTFNVRQPGTPN